MEHPEEWELVAFFGQQVDPLEKEEAEFFGNWRFTLTLDDGDILTFSLSRNFGDLAIALGHGRSKQIRLTARDVQTVGIEQLHGVETLVALFGTEPNLQEARLTLRPAFRLDWGNAGTTLR